MKCDVCGTVYRPGVPTPTNPDAPLAEYVGTDRASIRLVKTGHVVAAPVPGEGITYYFERIGGNPGLSGALLMYSEPYRIGNTGDPLLDLAIQVDAFANPETYGLGGPGAPGVAAGPAATSVQPMPAGGESLFIGDIPTGGVNTAWQAANYGQVVYGRAQVDGVYSAVCDGSVPVYVGVGFPPGVATFADLQAGGVRGTSAAECPVKAGQYFCFAHEGAPGNRMRASQR